jgi:hypothetical protein
MTGPMVLWGGVTNTDPTQVGLPSLSLDAQPESASTRDAIVRVVGPASWPGGTTTQLYTRRVPSPTWIATGSPMSGQSTLTYTRETDPFTIEVSGIASPAAGPLIASDRSAVVSFTVPGLDTVGVAMGARVRVTPSNSEAGWGVANPSQALILHNDSSPNVLLVDRTTNAETTTAVVLSAVIWRLEDRTTRQVVTNGACVLSGTTWRSVVRHPGGVGLVLVVELVPLIGARTRLRYATSWRSR